MKRLFQTCLLALLAVAVRAVETTLNVDTSQPKAVLPYLSFDQGAVYDYRVYVKSSGRRAELTGADVCVIQFSSNLTDSAWAVFTSTSVNTNNGSFLVPSGYFTGPLGDGFYQVYTYVTNNPARKYGLGNGTYRLEATSGYGAVTPGFYTVPLNTDIVEQTGSNRFARLSEIISASGYVTTNAFYGTTDVLRASVTALSGTVDATNALFNAWFAGLFSETNKWMSAYGWGNWADPVASNTAAIAVLQTNTLTNETDLAAMRLYHYGSADIIETDAAAFTFNPATGAITGYNYGVGGPNVVIPWSIGGVGVAAVGDAVFYETPILSAIGPKTLTSLGAASFSLSGVVYVNLPGVLNVGEQCFSDSQLKSLSLSSVTNLDSRALGYTTSLTSVYFYANSPTLGADVFDGSPNVINYVTNPNATGWSSTFGGMPVVRPPLYADSVTVAGTSVVTRISDAVANHVTDGTHTNVLLNVFRFPDNTSVSNGFSNGTNFISFSDPTGLTNAWLVLPW